jgi:hypothetical protein
VTLTIGTKPGPGCDSEARQTKRQRPAPVAFDWMKSFSRQTEAAFAFANALKQPAEFN